MNAIACRREKNINRCGNFIEIRSDVNIYIYDEKSIPVNFSL